MIPDLLSPSKPAAGKLKFDWTVNISTILAVFILIATVVNYGSRAMEILRDMQAKVNVMWSEYAKIHPDADAMVKAYHNKEY